MGLTLWLRRHVMSLMNESITTAVKREREERKREKERGEREGRERRERVSGEGEKDGP